MSDDPGLLRLMQEERALDDAVHRGQQRLLRTRDLIARLNTVSDDPDAPYRRQDAMQAYQRAAIVTPAEREAVERLSTVRLPPGLDQSIELVVGAVRRLGALV